MKRLAYTIFAAVLVMAATVKVSAQTEESRSVSGFHAVAQGGPFNVHIKIDGTESLKISASADVIKEIETYVEDGTLKIKFQDREHWNHEHIGRVDIYVTAKSLSALVNSGSGSIKVDGTVSGDDVRVTLSGSGNITSSVKSGDLHATISGSGSIHLDGSASDTKITISGSGEMMGKELKTGSANVTISGSGNAYFSADKTISARIVGSGSVVYSGSANVGDVHTIGSGRVSKAD